MYLDTLPEYWLPVLIFIARICDVSLGTVRIIFVSRGMRLRAALLGFVEILIWILIIAHLIQHLDNWFNFVAYAGGFAVGTYLGVTIENKLKVGTVLIRVITNMDPGDLVKRLREAGFMITRVEGRGGEGPVEIIFMVVRRKRWEEAVQIIESFDINAFYSIEDVKFTSAETPITESGSIISRLLRLRKGI